MRARLYVDFGLWKPCVFAKDIDYAELVGVEALNRKLKDFTGGKVYILINAK